MAAMPNDSLLEDSPFGRLPIIGPDGRRPMDQYARPWSGARGTRIAIVVSGLGLSQTGTQRAIEELPEEITLAFAASGNSLQRWMQEARRGGHEILMQVPIEPFDYPANDPGPETLLTSKSRGKEHREPASVDGRDHQLHRHHELSRRTLSFQSDAMEPVMRDIGKRGLLFLDDGSSAQSKTDAVAKGTELAVCLRRRAARRTGRCQRDPEEARRARAHRQAATARRSASPRLSTRALTPSPNGARRRQCAASRSSASLPSPTILRTLEERTPMNQATRQSRRPALSSLRRRHDPQSRRSCLGRSAYSDRQFRI